jgi:hypothetical protein
MNVKKYSLVTCTHAGYVLHIVFQSCREYDRKKHCYTIILSDYVRIGSQSTIFQAWVWGEPYNYISWILDQRGSVNGVCLMTQNSFTYTSLLSRQQLGVNCNIIIASASFRIHRASSSASRLGLLKNCSHSNGGYSKILTHFPHGELLLFS